jgi:polyphenol oxidase
MKSSPPLLFESPALQRLSLHLRHGFFGRRGGVSRGLYNSLNCGLGTLDDLDNVRENRSRVCRALGADPDRLITLRQVHSARCEIVESPYGIGQTPESDALVTRTPGLVLGILAADCAPVLLCDPHAGVAGAAHAGWRGAAGGVLEATIEAMVSLGAEPGRIVCGIGPCLGRSSFEVGPDLVEQVLAASPWADHLFAEGTGDRSQFDFKGYCGGRLARMGVGMIDSLAEDTLVQPDLFFSYRASQKAGHEEAGRNLSAIVLLP